MKKQLITLAVLLLLLTGCGAKTENPNKPEPTPELTMLEKIELSFKKMGELENYKGKISLSIEVPMEGATMNMSVTGEGVFDQKNKTNHLNMNANIFGMTVNAETYSATKDAMTTTYTYDTTDKTWSKETEKEEKNNFLPDAAVLKKALKTEEIKENDPNINHYRLVFSAKDVKELYKQFEDMIEGDEGETGAAVTGEVPIDIYINKDNMVTKLSLIISTKKEASESKTTMEFTFNDHNTAGTVTIPEDIIKNAILKTDDADI